MTMLSPTSRIVAMNSTRSDLSLRAISPSRAKAEQDFTRNYPRYGTHFECVNRRREDYDRVSGQQSSVGLRAKAPASQTGAACVPSSQSFTADNRLTTA